MHIHCNTSTISRDAPVLSNCEATNVCSTQKWHLYVWCLHMNAPICILMMHELKARGWLRITLCATHHNIACEHQRRRMSLQACAKSRVYASTHSCHIVVCTTQKCATQQTRAQLRGCTREWVIIHTPVKKHEMCTKGMMHYNMHGCMEPVMYACMH